MQLVLFLSVLMLTIGNIKTVNVNIKDRKNLNKNKNKNNKQPATDLGEDYDDNVVSYFEGWVHYYHYNNHTSFDRPGVFFVNNEFTNQREPLSALNEDDSKGAQYVPDKSAFFTVVNKDGVYIYNSRRDTLKNTVDRMRIDDLKPIPEDAYMKGGLNTLPLSKVGFCFEAKLNVPNGDSPSDMKLVEQTWVFCLKEKTSMEKMLKSLLKAKLKSQRKQGVFSTEDNIKLQKSQEDYAADLINTANKIPEDDRDNMLVSDPRNGYWMLLQNWTDCSLKCGGGVSYQHWRCIPPKNGGAPCVGEDVRTRQCNVQPCPTVEEAKEIEEVTKPEVLKPVVKIAPFSSRPQRYNKCVIKENDIFFDRYDEELKVTQKLPARLVMNNATISIFKDDTYQNIEYTWNLEKTTFVIPDSSFCCFELKDAFKATQVCGYQKDCGAEDTNDWVTKWKQDFGLFKGECHHGFQDTLLDQADTEKISNKAKKRLNSSRMDLIGQKEENLKKKLQMDEADAFRKNIKEVQGSTFTAIEKQMKMESLIEQEEKEKEEGEIQKILQKIEEEKDKEACLDTNIKEKELDTELAVSSSRHQEDIKIFTEEAKKNLEIRKAQMKQLILEMRGKAELKKAKYQAQLNAVRMEIAKKAADANKSGDIDKCKEGKEDEGKRAAYCNANFVDDYMRNEDCKSLENFCYMCCENEFGNTHIDKRETCYNMCDLPASPEEPKDNTGNGPWMWSPIL